MWITTIVACLSVTMSTSAVDNYQNAIADNISGVFLKQYSVWWSRLLVMALNVPCIVVSLRVWHNPFPDLAKSPPENMHSQLIVIWVSYKNCHILEPSKSYILRSILRSIQLYYLNAGSDALADVPITESQAELSPLLSGLSLCCSSTSC